MPVLFVGHGSPLNALETNSITKVWKKLGQDLPRPQAIVAISAHWEADGWRVTHDEKPPTIHDFYGFPDKLMNFQYAAPGSPALAREVATRLHAALDREWGLDHGTWSILTHMYPAADVPVVQFSLNRARTLDEHFEMGKRLSSLRNQGVLILASGNIVHNLRKVVWQETANAPDWAIRFDNWVAEKLRMRDSASICEPTRQGMDTKLAVPTREHYLPLVVAMGATLPNDRIEFPVTQMQNATISMRSVLWRAPGV